jgi:hypothetical protein
VASLFGKSITGSREYGCADKHGYIGELFDELGHQGQVLCTIVLGGHVDLKESNINIAQVIIITLRGVADEKFALGVVVFQPIFQGSAYETTSNNSNVNHILMFICLFV